MAASRLGIGVGAALLAGTLFAQATETPLARLEIGGGKAGWDGVTLGISSVQAERRVGESLAKQPAREGVAASTCTAFTANVERGTLRLTLGFPSAKPGAKLQSIFVHFEGYQVAARLEALVAELKAQAPGVTYLAPSGAVAPSAPSESADPMPAYLLPGEGGYAARVVPGDGLLLTLRDCLG